MFSDIQNISSASELLKTEAVDSRLNNRKNKGGEYQDNNRDDNNASAGEPEETTQKGFEARVNTGNDAGNDESANRFSVDSLIFFLEDFLEERIMREPTKSVQEQKDDESEEDARQKNIQDVSTLEPWLRSKPRNSNIPALPSSPPSLPSSQNREELRSLIAPRFVAQAYAHRVMLNNISRRTRQKVRQHSITNTLPPATESEKPGEKMRAIYNLIRDLRALKEQGITHLDVKDDAALFEGIGAAIRENGITSDLSE